MKVLLVYPEFPDTYWSFKHALAFEGKRSAFPPLGLMTISSMLPETWERRLVDMNVSPLTDDDIAWADIVFASAMLVQQDSLRDVVARSKALGKRVAVGGPFVTTANDDLGADYIFIGEAETTLPEFLWDLELGSTKGIYKAPERPSLALTPAPDFSIADLESYSAMSIQYSRGCPFQCEFCDIIEIYGRVPRAKSAGQMITELEALLAAGWRGLVFIVDDNFIGNKKSVKQFLPELIAWSSAHDHPFSYITEASVNLAEDEELLEMMRQARFTRVFLGIETPVEESLKETHKLQNTHRDLHESIRKIQGYGMEVMAGFIVGFDNDPEDIFDRQIEFIRSSGIPLAMVGLLNALPDTQLWRRLQNEGRLIEASHGNNTDCSINFVPRMDAERLVEGYKQILRTIYSSHEYYKRALDCLAQLVQEIPEHRYNLWREARSLFKLVLRLGVIDGERREFWQYFRSAYREHRRYFAHAMVLAAMGYHFRKLTEEYCG